MAKSRTTSKGQASKKTVSLEPRISSARIAPNTALTEESLIDERIAQLESDLDTLRRAKSLISNTAPQRPHLPSRSAPNVTRARRPKKKLSVAEASSMILKDHPQLHIRELLKRLSDLHKINTTEKNLSKTLNTWAKKKSLFKRVAPNTFAALEPKRKP